MSAETNSLEYRENSSLSHTSVHEEEKSIKPLSSKSKCAIIALVAGGIAGILIVGAGVGVTALGATNMFGAVGSLGFYASIVGGGVVAGGGGILTVVSGGGIIWIAITKKTNNFTAPKVGAGTETRNLSGIHKEASDFAKQALLEHPEVKPKIFAFGYEYEPRETHQPVNQDIALLANLYRDYYYPNFQNMLYNYKDNNPWSQEEVIQAADNLIKIAYEISSLTLLDLEAFTKALLEQKGEECSYANALTRKDSYQNDTYFYCTKAYHWIRGGIAWIEEDGDTIFVPPEETPEEHAALFYQEGTIQEGWRMLYNDFCDNVRSYVEEYDLMRAGTRHWVWTKKDHGVMTFSHTPGPLSI